MENTFENMLDNIYEEIIFLTKNKDQFTKNKFPEFILIKNGNKIIWKNIKEFLIIMNRQPTHFFDFLNFETSNKVLWVSESKSDGLNFNFKITSKILKELLNKYLNECVYCKFCKSSNTCINKNKDIRKYNLICNECNTNYNI